MAGSFTCSCNSGYTLASDRRTCNRNQNITCGGTLTEASGSFQTPGWPNGYPQQDFECEWIIQLPNNGRRIEFTVDSSAFGINGRPPCNSDHIQFFDGTQSGALSLRKVCRYDNPGTFTTTSSQSKVVFRGFLNLNRPAGRVGVRVTYRSI